MEKDRFHVPHVTAREANPALRAGVRANCLRTAPRKQQIQVARPVTDKAVYRASIAAVRARRHALHAPEPALVRIDNQTLTIYSATFAANAVQARSTHN